MKADRTKPILTFLTGVAGAAAVYAAIRLRREPGESFAMAATELLLLLNGKRVINDAEAFAARYRRRAYPDPAPIPRFLRERCDVREERVQGHPVFTLTPRNGKSSEAMHLLYTHGGAYVSPIRIAHWWIIGRLLEATGATVTVPLYPLAPEHTYHPAYSLLEQVYRQVTAYTPPHRVILCGDSAGGGLALGQVLHYRNKGLPLPGRMILFSPWLDLTMSNPEAAAVEKDDLMLGLPGLIVAGKWWAGEDDPHRPLLSPLFGDLSGLPPLDVFQGTHDVFIADARKLQEKVTAAGGEIRLYEYPGAFHVFVGATWTPEAKDAFARIAATVFGPTQ